LISLSLEVPYLEIIDLVFESSFKQTANGKGQKCFIFNDSPIEDDFCRLPFALCPTVHLIMK